MTFHSKQFGAKLEERGPNDPHVIIQLLGEDDEHWFDIGNGFSGFWLDDLISILQTVKTTIENSPQFEKDIVNGRCWGYKFRKDNDK